MMIDPGNRTQGIHLVFGPLRIVEIPILNTIKIVALVLERIHAKSCELGQIRRRERDHGITVMGRTSRTCRVNRTRILIGTDMVAKTDIDMCLLDRAAMRGCALS
jgi:hypothetical protein